MFGQRFGQLRAFESSDVLSARAGVEDAMPEGGAEGRGEFERVRLRNVAHVSIDDGACDNHWALTLVAEPAPRLQESELVDLRRFGEVVVECENIGGLRGGASLHCGARSQQTVNGLLGYALGISEHNDTR